MWDYSYTQYCASAIIIAVAAALGGVNFSLGCVMVLVCFQVSYEIE